MNAIICDSCNVLIRPPFKVTNVKENIEILIHLKKFEEGDSHGMVKFKLDIHAEFNTSNIHICSKCFCDALITQLKNDLI
jgi:hypothetical protein